MLDSLTHPLMQTDEAQHMENREEIITILGPGSDDNRNSRPNYNPELVGRLSALFITYLKIILS